MSRTALMNSLTAASDARARRRLPDNLAMLLSADHEGGVVVSRRSSDLDLLVTRGLATCECLRAAGDYRPNRLDWNYQLTAAGRRAARA